MRERDIEAYFVKRVREHGALQYKFVSPGHRGVPDRIVFFEGRVFMVELKAPGKTLRPEQEREHERLGKHGQATWTISTKEEVDYFLKRYV